VRLRRVDLLDADYTFVTRCHFVMLTTNRQITCRTAGRGTVNTAPGARQSGPSDVEGGTARPERRKSEHGTRNLEPGTVN
jgi:hypothetical protein